MDKPDWLSDYDPLEDFPVESRDGLVEWLMIASMNIKDENGKRVIFQLPIEVALQLADMMIERGLVNFNEGEE